MDQQKKPRKPGSGGARPNSGPDRFVLDMEHIERLARRLCTNREIAGHLGIGETTFKEHLASDPQVAAAMERGRCNAFISIRSKQFQLMDEGSVPMAIFLGKVQLGQREAVEIIDSRPKTYKYAWVGRKKEEPQKTIEATAEVVVEDNSVTGEKVQ